MNNNTVRKTVLPWLAGGILLGLVQVLAVGLHKPLGVSTQFAIVESVALHDKAPEYAQEHPLLKTDKYRALGYGFWLDVGLCAGALLAAIATWRWRPRVTTVWWRHNEGSVMGRFGMGFVGGILILFGARLAHGCTSGQFASGWAQLSLSAVPMTVVLFVAGMITARIVYPKAPQVEK